MTMATWRGVTGICAFWPLGGMQVVKIDGEPRVRPAPNTYLFADGPGDYANLEDVPDTWHFRTANLKKIVDAGFDHVRVQYEPTPIIEAILRNDTALLDFVLTQFDLTVKAILNANLGVALSGILAGFAGIMPPSRVFAGISAPEYLAYKEHLRILAERYAWTDPSMFVLEVFNEPPGNGSTVQRPAGFPNWGALYTGNWETDYQPELYQVIRDAMPEHTVILTCDGWSNWEILTTYDPTRYLHDTNVIWTYHPLEPTPASLCGFIYNQYYYIQRIAYPPGFHDGDGVIGTLEGSIADMERLIALRPWVATNGNPAATAAGLRSDLQSYYGTPEGYDFLAKYIGRITTWARRYGIPPGNIYASEYGSIRDNAGFPGNLLGLSIGTIGSTRLDRLHLYRDVTRVCIQNGHRRAIDHLDTPDYGITDNPSIFVGEFDPLIIDALALRNRRLLSS